jgi:hypothetical protein
VLYWTDGANRFVEPSLDHLGRDEADAGTDQSERGRRGARKTERPAARERVAIVGGHQDRTSVARTSGLSAEARESERGSSPDAKAEVVSVSPGFTRRITLRQSALRARLINGAASSLAAVPRTGIAG